MDSGFRGPDPEFVAHCQRNFGKGSEAKHLLWPARVAVNGGRATAETSVAIRRTASLKPGARHEHVSRASASAFTRVFDALWTRYGDEAIQLCAVFLDCFASLAMTRQRRLL